MASPSTSHLASRGFQMIEILIVIGLTTLLLSLGLIMSFDVFRGTVFRSTRTILVSALTTARGRALANLYQRSYGVCYSAPDFIIFRGTTYSASDPWNERTPGNANVTLTSTANFFTCGTGSGVVFSQVSGATTNTGTITVQESGHPDATIAVNSEGTIVW